MTSTAAILAGGLATRLRGVVDDMPKCLVEVNGRPFLSYMMEQLRAHAVARVVMLIGHRGDQVRAFLGDGVRFGVEVAYSAEPAPLGTAGAVKYAEGFLRDGPFLLLNGDTLADVDLSALWEAHCAAPEALATIALCEMDDISDYGSVAVDQGGRVAGFEEKRAQKRPGLVNAGVYCLSPGVFAHIPAGTKVSTETELLPGLLAAGRCVMGFRFRGGFVDIGTGERLAYAQGHPLFNR
ncbi:MAG: nucleotidyltransferase family protein [Candidatus Hydrogenedentes bacterium]|nr:nucleotidyltransferase family protein [Candidatus Hydrogenedentota bacterium]